MTVRFKRSSVIFTSNEHAMVAASSELLGLSKQDYLRHVILTQAKKDAKKTWPKLVKTLEKQEKQWQTGYHLGN